MKSAPAAGGSRHIRRLNQEAILRLVQQNGPISRTDIAKRLGLNPSTVNRLVEQLAGSGLLAMAGEQAVGRQGGRPAQLVEFNPDVAQIVALDLSNVPWRGALVNLEGTIERVFEATPELGKADANLAILADLLDRMLDHNQKSQGPALRGIGVGAPSITLWETGTVVWAASLGWRNLPLKAWIEERWSIPAFVENDVNLLALGESWLGAGQQAENLVVMAVGTGIGAGLILNGRLYRGVTEAAGEVGYIPPDRQALGRRHTGYGPLEALAAAPGLLARAQQAIADGRESLLRTMDLSDVESIYRAARQNDALARFLLDETADYLSLAVASLSVVLNPEIILLGGEITRAADLLLDPIRQRLEGLLPAMPRLELVRLGVDGVLLGAVALVLRNTSADVAGLQVAWP